MQITTFLKPLSSLYFIELPPYFRIFFALAILVQPNVGIAGLIGLLFAAFYLKFLHISYEAKISSCSLLNAMLVSLLIGSLFALNLKTLFLIAIFVFLTLVVTAATEFIFAQFYLSALSLPFCIVALMIFILLPDFYQFLPIAPLWTIDLTQFMPNFIVMFFHALSSILCITNPSIGILIWIIILLFSPLTALFLVIGWAIGIGAESFIHNVNQNLFLYGTDFNYALVFTAIAGFFLTPSRSSLLLASFFTIITSLVAVVSNKILNPYNLPALSIPFCLVTSAAILTLRYFCPSLLNTKFFVSPEKNIETSYSSWNRHRFPEIGVFLPFSGKWQVQQAFNGDITHRGSLKYALDFVALNEEGKIFANSGLELTDHFSFSKEILSPVEGFVT
ncbi:MAG: urea transporter [Rickettsiales bacterium]|nr:urea transporter [Rickettsiales bacterium]